MLLCPTSPHKTASSRDGKGWIFTEKSTGVILRQHSLDVLQGMVDKHRFAVAGTDGVEVDLAVGWQNRFLDEICRQNPNAPCQPNPQADGFEPPHVAQGRALWIELHAKAEEENEPYALREWFENNWLNRVPNYVGCKCRENAVILINSMPPDYGAGFKAWAINFHNSIRRKLGQKQWPFEVTPSEVQEV